MNAYQRAWICDAQPSGGKRAIIATLGSEALVSQNICHQIVQAVGDLLDAETRLPWPKRKTEAGQGRCDDREGVARIAAEPGRIGQARNNLHELEDAARPSVHQQ